MDNINILVEAKKEYTSQLQKILKPRLYEGFKSMYEDIINILSKELEENKTQSSSIIKTFQKMLRDIPQWNHEIIKNEYLRIEKISNCDYIDNLIEAVFITNTKILTSVQINDSKSLDIRISVPQPSHFIHKCYIESAKEIYKNPYIFDQSKNLTPKERHNNLREILNIIDHSIDNAIRDLLPIRDILKQGLTKNKFEEKSTKEDVTEIVEEKVKDIKEVIQGGNKEVILKEEENTDEVEQDDINEEGEEVEAKVEEGETEEEEGDDDVDEEGEHEEEGDDDVDEQESEGGKKVEDTNEKTENINEFSEQNFEEDVKDSEKKEIIIDMNEDVSQYGGKEEVIEAPLEIRKIVYNKVEPTFLKKLKNIEKIDGNDTAKNIQIGSSIISGINDVEKKNIQTSTIKNIKNKFFIKNKHMSINKSKDTSFYKKKYKENSANYDSISLTNTLETYETKSVKNKIIIDMNSSDEENNDDMDI